MAVLQTTWSLLSGSVNYTIPLKPFNRSIPLKVIAEPFTQVPEYGPLHGHLGVLEEGVVKKGFTPHRLLANICLYVPKKCQQKSRKFRN